MMAEKGIYLVATDYPADFYVNALGQGSRPADERQAALENARRFEAASRERVQSAVKMG